VSHSDGRGPSLGTFPSWAEADGVRRAALEELGEGSGVTAVVETVQTSAPGEPDGLLSARDAAGLLGVSLSTFKDTVQADLPTISIGRRVLFDREDVIRWRNEHKAAGSFDSPRGADGGPISSVSVTVGSASSAPRAKAILARLRSKQRASTRT
jgi:predicted DNA-binding transcriptional regulator AlpA